MKIAWVFPGQGSQKVGMADPLLDMPETNKRFDQASQILGRDLLAICKGKADSINNELKDLNDTRNTQPALFVVESILVDELKKQGRNASLLAGHSLGEISALYAAEVFDFKTAVLLLQKRSELMASAGGGAMTAVMGFDREQLEELVKSTKEVVIANDNSSSQVVLSGSPEAVNKLAEELTCKRAIPLKVSGAFHSPFMESAANSFNEELEKIVFNDAIIPIISNSKPSPETNGSILKERLKKQMTTGVRWRETMEILSQEKIEALIEIGPGNVLSGLAKRSMKDMIINQISNSTNLGN